MKTRVAQAVLAVCVLALVAVPLVGRWTHSSPVERVSAVGSRALGQMVVPEPDSPAGAGQPASTKTVEAQLGTLPIQLQIPSLGIDARIFPVGQDRAGAVEIPDDVDDVGWYEPGVPPGAHRGSAVLVAHRDGKDQGRGALYDLGNLAVGDRVTVIDAVGAVLVYKVVSREAILKSRLPYEELFAVDGPPRLTLISCGGYYDPDNGGYQDNVVVTAVLDT